MGGSERGEDGVLQVEFGAGPAEELGVPRYGPGPAALDEADPESVELTCDGELVLDRQHHAFLLGAVAQGRVVELEAPLGHRPSLVLYAPVIPASGW